MIELLKRADDAEQLAHTLLLFAAKLRETAAEAQTHDGLKLEEAPELAMPRDTHLAMMQAARWNYRSRRKRGNYFDPDLFGEPAWDMLLDLYISFISGRDISVSSLCLASDGPATTALRWISILEQNGLLERQTAQHDARISYVRLTKAAVNTMQRYLLDIEFTREKQSRSFMLAPS